MQHDLLPPSWWLSSIDVHGGLPPEKMQQTTQHATGSIEVDGQAESNNSTARPQPINRPIAVHIRCQQTAFAGMGWVPGIHQLHQGHAPTMRAQVLAVLACLPAANKPC
jgi:hypothetical protein